MWTSYLSILSHGLLARVFGGEVDEGTAFVLEEEKKEREGVGSGMERRRGRNRAEKKGKEVKRREITYTRERKE